ncbi:hypothetical protein [Klebsiella pneumoniae]|uniref:hypothetical protein n=1 Tax=Klebsiella pneumoniae TaxID=573 RepID=UPI001E4DB5EE|nr:hypothetical protein [Klebsiella pneumoniae]UOV84364.1 hypothetical protein MU320_28865 [Klebsiella pneumoniae]
MSTKPAYQIDSAGHFVCETVADESPLEPGTYLVPAGAVLKAPPKKWAADKWPRWNGAKWELVTKPAPANDNDPVAKLQAFLVANPDVAAILKQGSV